jgi:SAM-dependent methyltransferase
MKEMELPAMQCPICESSSALALTKDGRPYFQCSSCDFLFHRGAKEDPGKSALGFYDQSYWEMERNEARRRESEDSFIRALELLYLSGIKVKHVLDFGCGLGITVQMLREKLGLNAVGVDLSADFGETKYLHRCEVGALRNLYPPDYFDAIYSIEVFEHLEDPKQVISVLGTLLKPGGRILINTGTREYLIKHDPELTYIDPLRRGHISIYSLRSLSHLASMIGHRAEFMGARTYAVIMSPSGELPPVPHPDNIETIRRLGDWFPMLLREYMRLIPIEQESENKGIWAHQLLKEGETLRSEQRKLEEDLEALRNELRPLKQEQARARLPIWKKLWMRAKRR